MSILNERTEKFERQYTVNENDDRKKGRYNKLLLEALEYADPHYRYDLLKPLRPQLKRDK